MNINITPVEIWLAVSIVFILLEFTTVPGIGFLFIGFGAMLSSIIFYNYPDLQHYQVAVVGFSSLACFLILWWPLKAFMYGRNKNSGHEYSDIIGKQVEVALNDIQPDGSGQVYWSGTIMNAQICEGEKMASIGEKLYIKEIKGNVLICSHNRP